MRTALAWLFASTWVLLGVPCASCQDEVAATEGPAPGVASGGLPAAAHCGRILRLERVEMPLPRIDLSRAIATGNLDAGTGDDLSTEIPPQDGKVYAVFTVEVQKGRSIGTFDYALEASGQTTACLGLAVGDNPYDRRRWQTSSEGEVKLLFEVPAGAKTVSLVPALVVGIPLRAIPDLAFGVDESEGAVVKTEPAQAPTAGGESATAEGKTAPSGALPVSPTEATTPKPEPEPKSQPKPELEPKSQPKPEPKSQPKPVKAPDALDF